MLLSCVSLYFLLSKQSWELKRKDSSICSDGLSDPPQVPSSFMINGGRMFFPPSTRANQKEHSTVSPCCRGQKSTAGHGAQLCSKILFPKPELHKLSETHTQASWGRIRNEAQCVNIDLCLQAPQGKRMLPLPEGYSKSLPKSVEDQRCLECTGRQSCSSKK